IRLPPRDLHNSPRRSSEPGPNSTFTREPGSATGLEELNNSLSIAQIIARKEVAVESSLLKVGIGVAWVSVLAHTSSLDTGPAVPDNPCSSNSKTADELQIAATVGRGI